MKDNAQRKVWTKPELKRLGKMKDVADSEGAGPQSSANKS